MNRVKPRPSDPDIIKTPRFRGFRALVSGNRMHRGLPTANQAENLISPIASPQSGPRPTPPIPRNGEDSDSGDLKTGPAGPSHAVNPTPTGGGGSGSGGGGFRGRKITTCSFCGKTSREVGPMVEGPGDVYICTNCTDLCQNIFRQERRRVDKGQPLFSSIPTPRHIRDFLDQYVIGQERAKRSLAVAVHTHYKRLMHVENEESSSDTPERARRSSREPSLEFSMSPSQSATRPRSPRPAMSAKTLRTSYSNYFKPRTTISKLLNGALSTSMRSTRSARRATTSPSPAMSRAKASSNRC